MNIWTQDGREWGVEKATRRGTSQFISSRWLSRKLRWAGHVARMEESRSALKLLGWAGHLVIIEEGRSAFKILTGKPTGKRLLGRPRRRWENNIRMDLK